jgi:hypothetical protein
LKQDLARLDQVLEEFLPAMGELPETGLDQTVVGKPYSIRFVLEGAVRHHV